MHGFRNSDEDVITHSFKRINDYHFVFVHHASTEFNILVVYMDDIITKRSDFWWNL